MRLKAALVFLLTFGVAVRVASSFSWATSGAPLTAAGLVGALAVAGVAAGLWYTRRPARHPIAVRTRHGRFATATWA